MKLNKKGLERISKPILEFVDGYYDYAIVETLEDHEFEPDDFEGGCCQNGKGHVTLTVEEAKAVLKAIDIWNVEDDEIYDKLEQRIKQAEKANA